MWICDQFLSQESDHIHFSLGTFLIVILIKKNCVSIVNDFSLSGDFVDTVQDTKFSNWLRTRHHFVQDMVTMLMQLFLNTLFPHLADIFGFCLCEIDNCSYAQFRTKMTELFCSYSS